MKKVLAICLLVFAISAVNPCYALEGRRTFEAATEDALAHLPYSWTPSITSKAKVCGAYVNIHYMDATPYYVSFYLDSNKGATYDMLLATEYLGGVKGTIYYSWEPTDLIIEKGDSIRLTIGSSTNLAPKKYTTTTEATPFSALIKLERQ